MDPIIVYVSITVLVVFLIGSYIKNHKSVKCANCGARNILKIICTSADYSHPNITHYYIDGNCRKCRSDISDHWKINL